LFIETQCSRRISFGLPAHARAIQLWKMHEIDRFLEIKFEKMGKTF